MCNENETTQLIPLVDDGGGESKRAGSGKPMNRQTSDDFIASFSEALSESMQRIGVLGSVSIAVNSLTGPAMLTLPATYQRSGLIPTTAAIVFTCILSAFCCLHMSNTISKVQHNHDFSFDIGYSECFRRLWGPKSYNFTQVLFFLCVTCLNVSSIVDTAEVVDTFFGHWVVTGTMAINFQWIDNQLSVRLANWDYSNCSEESLIAGECVPYHGATGILLTSGYVVTLLTFLPMALMDLKENATIQVVGFLVLLVTSCGFIVLFLSEGLKTGNLSLWGTEWGSLFGVILFNFALVIAIPAWLYEKEPHVNVPVVIHSSSFLTSVLYISIGVLGAITVPHASQNMLESLMSGVFGTAIQLCSSLFAFFIIGLGCPLFSVLARMNLTDGNALMSRNAANGLAVYMPFFFSWIFYKGDAIIKLLSWGGIIFTSLLAFVLPLLLSLHSLERGDDDGSVNVYKPWSVTSKRTQKKLLLALLGLAIASIFA
eukprot:CAMPEP_0172356626 /NCGR_PEP_ID=MMETSP1060-20121228/1017_1 /TAXON_ID=37318 /ORGANISM="Pseudo-nitzschia pungens, Strain cf. cingulata" /LENGTH=484 /DNA_ID=CAMNT_0013076857 /DNA_START=215 /DNA_END=1665 /DNA_ORIENTATION=+